MPDREKLRKLRKQIHSAFDLSDLQDLCFDLAVDYEDLGGESVGKSVRIRKLIDKMSRNGRLPDLMSTLLEYRPHIDWVEVVPATTDSLAQLSTHQLGQLYNVPSLPPNHIPRPDDLTRLRQAILDLKGRAATNPSHIRMIGLQGMGGIGKSVLATALVWDEALRQTFTDGLFWLSIGQTPMLATRQKQLATGLKPTEEHIFQDAQEGRAELGRLLAHKHCLIILDDIWELNHVTAFDALAESQSLILITTRNAGLVESLGAIAYNVDLLEEDEALNLLYQAAEINRPARPEPRALAVVRECGRLPLAVAMIGGMVRNRPSPWQRALRRLQKADLSRIKETFPHYPYPDLLRAIQVSVEALGESLADLQPIERYLDLAVFPKETPIPLGTLEILWEPAGLDELDTEDLTDALVGRSLAQRDKEGALHLHDLQVVYVRQNVNDLAAKHNQLLEAYAEQADGDWSQTPDDSYFFDHLARHLIAANRAEELIELLFDFHWLMAKLAATGVNQLLADYETALKLTTVLSPENKQGLLLVQGAIRLASHIISQNTTMLPSQLLGRLPLDMSPSIDTLRSQAEAWQDAPWLRPLTVSLTAPGGPLQRTLQIQAEAINAIALTPNGQRLLIALNNGTVKVWNLPSGREERILKGHERAVHDVVVTTDGRQAFTAAADHTVKLWHLEDGTVARTFEGHSRTVNGLALTPNGRRVLSVSNDKTVKVWDIGTGVVAFSLGKKHRDSVEAVAVTPDGRFALSVGKDRRIRTWDLSSGQSKFAAYKHSAWVNDIVITPDGQRALSASDDKTIKVWDLNSRRETAVLRGHTSWVKAVAVTPDGQKLLSASQDGTVRVWDLNRYAEIAVLQGHTAGVNDVLVTQDGKLALSASEDGTINVWHLADLDLMETDTGHMGDIKDIAVLGSYAFTGSEDATVQVWDTTTGERVATLSGHTAPVTALAVSPDKHHIVSAAADNSIKVWSINGWEEIASYTSQSQAITFTPDGQMFLSASGSMTQVFNWENMEEEATLKWHGGTVNSIAVLSHKKQVVTAANDKKIKLWDLQTGQSYRLGEHTKHVLMWLLLPQIVLILFRQLTITPLSCGIRPQGKKK